jgi:predicted RNA-binding Zn ribbon-like protein
MVVAIAVARVCPELRGRDKHRHQQGHGDEENVGHLGRSFRVTVRSILGGYITKFSLLRVTCQSCTKGYIMTSETDTKAPHIEILGHHGHQAPLQAGLDFVNTLEIEKGVLVDHLRTPNDAVSWLRGNDLLHHYMVHDLIERTTSDPAAGEQLMRRIRRVRGALRELLDAAVERRPPDPSALREVNRWLRAQYVYELVPASDGISLDHRHDGDPVEGALARLAETIARELTQGDAERLRICANDECRWVFFDTSAGGRRKWCDMSICGNRAKVARHRARQRELEIAFSVMGMDDVPPDEAAGDDAVGEPS